MNFQYENQQQNNTSNLNEFTDQEIREQLEYLGFKNISQDKFNQFKNDLEKLISQEASINTSTSSNYSNIYQNKAKTNDINRSRRACSTSPTRSIGKDFQEEKFFRNNNKKVTFPDDSHLCDGAGIEEYDEEAEDSDQSFASIITTSSIVNNDNKVIKRKIIRKQPGQNNKLQSAINQASRKESVLNEFEEVVEDADLNNSDYDDVQEEQVIQLNDCYPPVRYPMKSFIRSQSSLSLASTDSSRVGFYKANPVNKFHEYKKLWNKQKMPGEKNHNDLRWAIREQMLTKDVIVKRQHKAYEPNLFAIPTDKKRQQLRWAVRSALANQF